MDFSSTIDNLKEKISSLSENVSDWINENKKLSLIIGGLVLLILICLILLSISLDNEKKKNKKSDIPENFTLTENLQIPLKPELDKDYNLSRKTQNQWSDEEVTTWFTEPSLKEVENLSKSNNKIVDDILGAAP